MKNIETKKLKNKLKQNSPKELISILSLTEFEPTKKINSIFEIWGAKKNKDKRKFYIVDNESLGEVVDLIFDSPMYETTELIVDRIIGNDKLFYPSIKTSIESNLFYYDYVSFSDYYSNDEYDEYRNYVQNEISKMKFASKKIISSDITSMYENTYSHTFSWALNGKETYKKYYSNGFIDKKLKQNVFLDSEQSENRKHYLNLDAMDCEYRRNIRKDSETVGLLTGLPISDMFADFILSGIDLEIKKIDNFGEDFDFFHFKDNYTYIFYTSNDEKIFKVMLQIQSIFLKYKYSINWEYNGKKIENKFENKIDWENVMKNLLEYKENLSNYNFNPYIDDEEEFIANYEKNKENLLELLQKEAEEHVDSNKKHFWKKYDDFRFFSPELYSKSEIIKNGMNKIITNILENPMKVLELKNIKFLTSIYIEMEECEKKRLKKYVENFWEIGFEMEFIAWQLIFNSENLDELYKSEKWQIIEKSILNKKNYINDLDDFFKLSII